MIAAINSAPNPELAIYSIALLATVFATMAFGFLAASIVAYRESDHFRNRRRAKEFAARMKRMRRNFR